MSSTRRSIRLGAIVIAHNEADWIGAALESLMTQSRPLDEIVVVDDGSTDSTLNAARAALRGSTNATVISTRKQGRGQARNFAISKTTTDVVIIADADDVSTQDRVMVHHDAFASDDNLDWHSGQVKLIDDFGNPLRRSFQYPVDPSSIDRELKRGNMPFSHAACAFRVSERLPTGPYSPKMLRAQDLELLLTMSNPRISISEEVLLNYRVSRTDDSWGTWQEKLLWRSFAHVHARDRREHRASGTFDDWLASLDRVDAIRAAHPAAWMVERLRNRGAPIPRLSSVRRAACRLDERLAHSRFLDWRYGSRSAERRNPS